jgi:hypothetical protein
MRKNVNLIRTGHNEFPEAKSIYSQMRSEKNPQPRFRDMPSIFRLTGQLAAREIAIDILSSESPIYRVIIKNTP